MAPFSLQTYEELAAYRIDARAAISSREMPPWQAARCCNHYFEDRSLTEVERETLLRFLDEGMPRGTPGPTDAPPPQTLLSRVDVSVTMPEAYVPDPQQGTDDNRCFVLDWPLTEATYITGLAPRPGVRGQVHHVLIAVAHGESLAEAMERDAADPLAGYDCNGGLGNLREVVVLGGSVQGGDLPRDLGSRIEPGGKLLLNIHYSTLSSPTPLPDRTSIDFRVSATARETAGIPIANPGWLVGDSMEVKAGEADAVYFYKYRPTLLTPSCSRRILTARWEYVSRTRSRSVSRLAPRSTDPANRASSSAS
jgi:hypothetical protein